MRSPDWNDDWIKFFPSEEEMAELLTRTIHLSERYGSLLCGQDAKYASTAGWNFKSWRNDPRSCAACVAVAALMERAIPWWRVLDRLRRRQTILRIRRDVVLRANLGAS